MKKILLGLFILGTLGMAQNHYEVYIKNGVNISQNEVNNDSDQIKGIVDKMIGDFESHDKKIMLENYRITILREKKNGDSYKKFKNYKKFNDKDKEFCDKVNKITLDELIKSLDYIKFVLKSISFIEKNTAEVKITITNVDYDSIDKPNLFFNALKKAGLTDKELDNYEDITKLSNQKRDLFLKYLSEELRKGFEEAKVDDNIVLKFKKINRKWQTKDELYKISEI